jgi:NAD(P)-dependent dehydrogenase (short-subunit alcohol dehydrogenase family)
MPEVGSVVVIAGTTGLGRALAEHFAREREVSKSSRDPQRADVAAKEIGGRTVGFGLDLSKPEGIRDNLPPVGRVRDLILVAGERDYNAAATTTSRRLAGS